MLYCKLGVKGTRPLWWHADIDQDTHSLKLRWHWLSHVVQHVDSCWERLKPWRLWAAASARLCLNWAGLRGMNPSPCPGRAGHPVWRAFSSPRPLQGHSCRQSEQIPSLSSSLCILLFPMGKSNPISLGLVVGLQAGTTSPLRHMPQDPAGTCPVDWMRSSSADSECLCPCSPCLLQSREVSCLDVQVNDGRLRRDTMGEPFTDLWSKSGCHLMAEALSALHLSMLFLKLFRMQDNSLMPVAGGGGWSWSKIYRLFPHKIFSSAMTSCQILTIFQSSCARNWGFFGS